MEWGLRKEEKPAASKRAVEKRVALSMDGVGQAQDPPAGDPSDDPPTHTPPLSDAHLLLLVPMYVSSFISHCTPPLIKQTWNHQIFHPNLISVFRTT